MQRSTDRFLTTHTGSLPRPDDLIRTMYAKEEGVPVDPVALEQRIAAAVAEVVQKQVDSGIDVVNDGEVTALAGSMSMKANAVLGYSMGTSVAAGYVTPDGNITSWLNELAFVPIDYRDDAPADEWSGDIGCGVQYFSQQAVSRLLPAAGIALPKEMPLAERLVEVQKLMAQGDSRARQIYETIGTCFGYAIAHYGDFYDIENMLVLGRVEALFG
jgi:predicted NBD/HSP70 family sugar kinase